jgi:formimidoylglutamate deiminase
MSLSVGRELIYRGGAFVPGAALGVDSAGRIAEAGSTDSWRLDGRAMLPGFINVHSHSFQRLIRGRAESRAVSGRDFWSWRGTMYHAAARPTPEDVYDVARMAFLEMVKAGTTTVGEFHYLHNGPDGRPYSDANELGHLVIAAARSVGIRIVLLRSAYLRSGFEVATDPGQTRFFETADAFIRNTEALLSAYAGANDVTIGIAPHSIRAVPLAELKGMVAWGRQRGLPIHMHVAEQVAENAACEREYGTAPVALLAEHGLLGEDFTAVHAIHITDAEIAAVAKAGATICSCPTTERNLGDGILAADKIMRTAIPVALGSDSQAQIDPMEDARQLDLHLRLQQQQRAVLDGIRGEAIAKRLFDCATKNGARALGIDAGDLTEGKLADFVSVDLDDLSIAGNSAEDLLPVVVFGMERTAMRDVAVGGKLILRDGRHELEDEIVARYKAVHGRVWELRDRIQRVSCG